MGQGLEGKGQGWVGGGFHYFIPWNREIDPKKPRKALEAKQYVFMRFCTILYIFVQIWYFVKIFWKNA